MYNQVNSFHNYHGEEQFRKSPYENNDMQLQADGLDGLMSLAKVANEQLGREIAKEKRRTKSKIYFFPNRNITKNIYFHIKEFVPLSIFFNTQKTNI